MKKPRHLWEETFKMNYWFMVGYPEKEVEVWFKKQFDHDTDYSGCDGKTSVLERRDGMKTIVVWVRKKNMLPELAHEVCHAAMFTFTHAKILHTEETDQAFCLLLERLFRFAREGG